MLQPTEKSSSCCSSSDSVQDVCLQGRRRSKAVNGARDGNLCATQKRV